jgi:hypothetical protein
MFFFFFFITGCFMANPSIKETVFFISPCVTNTEVKKKIKN